MHMKLLIIGKSSLELKNNNYTLREVPLKIMKEKKQKHSTHRGLFVILFVLLIKIIISLPIQVSKRK